MHLTMFPPRFRVANLAVVEEPAFATGSPFVQAEGLDLSVRLLPLLKGVLQVDSLNLRHPSIDLVKTDKAHGIFHL